MLDISLTPINEADIYRQLSVLMPQAIKRAEVSGINRAANSSRVLISKTVRRDLALKAKTVKDAMTIKRARYAQSTPEATITVDRKPQPLKNYGARQIRSGLSAKIRKRGRQKIKSGFIIGAYGGNAYKRETSARGPLKALMGPSVGGAVSARSDEVEQGIVELVDKNIRDRIAWEITKLLR